VTGKCLYPDQPLAGLDQVGVSSNAALSAPTRSHAGLVAPRCYRAAEGLSRPHAKYA
jgi:hypothetical protein